MVYVFNLLKFINGFQNNLSVLCIIIITKYSN